ncbi:hypothetical protein SAMN04488063_0691 [Halopelagius inordinatus]|uniref:Uncharacterized protein n=1 Tax=Halopelagius inordinatus TaxID=553467 RepID=A0A1I2MDB6_9EURY|nr:hypothetical protein [Halopelagius inordinatus]SFF89455.1 hypothetical protein SAMN04488063_0691 [Halopelagius inordinatus]
MTADRGQVVLLAAVVVAVALVPMTVAYAQLGYDADRTETPGPTDPSRLDEARETLRTSLVVASADVDGAYTWGRRDAAAETVRDAVDADARRLARDRAGDERSLTVSANGSAAARWAGRRCPRGDGRNFGSCVVEDGVVVQDRAGETTVVAAAFDLSVVGPGERSTVTVVVRPVA